jgi:hypothetical protein
MGWLRRNGTEGDFFDWKGNIYKGHVHGKLWRGNNLWASYTDAQMESMLQLIKSLVTEYHIAREFSGNNLPLEGAKDFKGVLNRSNYFRYYYDLSPAADFERIKEYVELLRN